MWSVAKSNHSPLTTRHSTAPNPPATIIQATTLPIRHPVMTEIRYFKRFRMELPLDRPLPPVPELLAPYFWLPWDDGLIDAHARAKFASFHGEIDTEVFPSLGSASG